LLRPHPRSPLFPYTTLFRSPRAGKDIPVTVSFRVEDGREHWKRTFAGRSFSSMQEQGRGRFERLLCERFGPIAFGMALVCEDGRDRKSTRLNSSHDQISYAV